MVKSATGKSQMDENGNGFEDEEDQTLICEAGNGKIDDPRCERSVT